MIKSSVLRILVQGYRYGDGMIIKDRERMAGVNQGVKHHEQKSTEQQVICKTENVWKYKTAQNLLKAL